MATERIVEVRKNGEGGAYPSLNEALNSESANLVSLDRQLTINCYAMKDTVPADSGVGYTTDNNHFIHITTPLSERHSGMWNENAYNLDVITGNALKISTDHVKISGIQSRSLNGNSLLGDNISGSAYIYKNIFYGRPTDYMGVAHLYEYANYPNYYIYNNLVVLMSNANSYALRLEVTDPGRCYVYNNSLISTISYAFVCNNGTISYNNLFYGGAVAGSFIPEADYNSHTNYGTMWFVTYGKIHDRFNQIFTFVNPDDNYKLSITDQGAKGFGTNLTNDPYLPITDDIAGNPRPAEGPWDIGAFTASTEYVPRNSGFTGFQYVDFASGISSRNSLTTATSTPLNIEKGDILVCWASWESSSADLISISDGINEFKMEPIYTEGSNYNYGCFGICTVSSPNKYAIFNATLNKPYDTPLHTAIDLGTPAKLYTGGGVNYSTMLDSRNPANASGIIDTIEIYCGNSATKASVWVGTFYNTGSLSLLEQFFNCRDFVRLEMNTGYNVFEKLNLKVEIGDFLGVYSLTNFIRDESTGGFWYSMGYSAGGSTTNNFDFTNVMTTPYTQNYTYTALRGNPVYATGYTINKSSSFGIMQFRPNSVTNISKDISETNSGNSINMVSDTITTTGQHGIIFGAGKAKGSNGVISQQIGDVSSSIVKNITDFSSMWCQIYNQPITVDVKATLIGSDTDWICNVFTIKGDILPVTSAGMIMNGSGYLGGTILGQNSSSSNRQRVVVDGVGALPTEGNTGMPSYMSTSDKFIGYVGISNSGTVNFSFPVDQRYETMDMSRLAYTKIRKNLTFS